MNADEHNRIKTLLFELHLGELLAPPVVLQGGELHKLYYVQTSTDGFAVKALNPYFYRRKDFPEHYEQTEAFAYALSQKGVPAVYAHSFDGRRVVYEREHAYLIYPYVSGKILETSDLTSLHIRQLGAMISGLHQAGGVIASDIAPQFDYCENVYWQTLIEEIQDPLLLQLLPSFLRWNAQYRQAQAVLVENCLMSHCDLHSKNVLWDKLGHVNIIDWENAGSVNPHMEVLGFALEWSGIVEQRSVERTVLAGIFSRYFETLPKLVFREQAEAAFYGWLGHVSMGWTEFNIRRAYGKVACSEAEQRRAKTLLNHQAIPFFFYIHEDEGEILKMIRRVL